MLTPEQQCLLDRAVYTWLRRGEAKAAGLPFGEETVTETILLDLKMAYPGDIIIIPFNKRQEGKIGADWEWCFVSHDEKMSLPMLVQAKVLNNTESAYDHVSRTIGNTGIRQIDRLIEVAKRRDIPAAYAFYNHLSDPSSLRQNCMSLSSGQSQSEAWGISVADAFDVRELLPDQSFAAIMNVSYPLHCLLCSQGRPSMGPNGSPGAISDKMSQNMEPGPQGDRGNWQSRPGLPEYYHTARRFLELPKGEAERDQIAAELREKLSAANPDIDGIVILKDSGTAAPQE
jgi:hypothetical protein